MNTTKMKVQNLEGTRGNKAPNQFEIITPAGRYFQSYESVICFVPNEGQTLLDKKYYNYSKTTSKYRNLFLGEDSKTIEAKISSGVYALVDLNS